MNFFKVLGMFLVCINISLSSELTKQEQSKRRCLVLCEQSVNIHLRDYCLTACVGSLFLNRFFLAVAPVPYYVQCKETGSHKKL